MTGESRYELFFGSENCQLLVADNRPAWMALLDFPSDHFESNYWCHPCAS